MAKLSKARIKTHHEACALVDRHHAGEKLTPDERDFIAWNWEPAAEHNIGWIDAFFTPEDMAQAMAIESLNFYSDRHYTILDLCAGIGRLSLAHYQRHYYNVGNNGSLKYICLERNESFVRVGQAVFPQAEWIRADMEDAAKLLAGRKINWFITNPPFSKGTGYRAIEIAAQFCDMGTAILPPNYLNWHLSGRQYFEYKPNPKYTAWSARTGIRLDPNCGIDCTCMESFQDTKILVDIVCVQVDREKAVESTAPALTLDQHDDASLAAEVKAQEQRAKIKAGLAKPLTGDAGILHPDLLDARESDMPLFAFGLKPQPTSATTPNV